VGWLQCTIASLTSSTYQENLCLVFLYRVESLPNTPVPKTQYPLNMATSITWLPYKSFYSDSLLFRQAAASHYCQHSNTKTIPPPSPAIYRRRRTKQSVNPANKYTTHLRTRGINCRERSRGGLVHCIQEKRRFPKFPNCSFIWIQFWLYKESVWIY